MVLGCAAPGNSPRGQEDPEEAHGPSKHWGGEKESDWGSVPRLELTDGGILVFFTLSGATAGPSGIGSWGWGGWRAPLCPGGVRCSLDPPAGSKRCQGAVGQLFLSAGPLTAPVTCFYPDSPQGQPGRAARAPPCGDRAQLWELPARCGQNREVCFSSEKPELRSLSSPGLREGAAGGLGHGVPPLKVLPPPQRGPAGSLGLDTSMPPAGHTCQTHSIAFCLKAINHVFLSLVYRCCRERFIAVVLTHLRPPS